MNSLLAIRPARRSLAAGVLFCLLALCGWVGPGFGATPNQAPPLPPGQARVWFLRQLLPGSIVTPPTIYVNGAPIARIAQGTAFYRDFAPGQYTFSPENCLRQAGTAQTMTLRPNTQYALLVQQDDNGAWNCYPHQVSYLQQVEPQQVPYEFAPLTYLGAM